jgi:hypothetical protein
MLKKIILAVFISFMCSLSYSQSSNGWSIFTSLRETKGISLGGNIVWAATSGGLFKFDVNNSANIKKYTTLDGLRSNELTAVSTGSNGLV